MNEDTKEMTDIERETFLLQKKLESALHLPRYSYLTGTIEDLNEYNDGGTRYPLEEIWNKLGISFIRQMDLDNLAASEGRYFWGEKDDAEVSEEYFSDYKAQIRRVIRLLQTGEIQIVAEDAGDEDEPDKKIYRYIDNRVLNDNTGTFEDMGVENDKLQFLDVFRAIEYNNVDLVRQLVEAKPELIHTRDSCGDLPIHTAVNHIVNIEILEYLIVKGSDINATDKEGLTTLHLVSGFNPFVAKYHAEKEMRQKQMDNLDHFFWWDELLWNFNMDIWYRPSPKLRRIAKFINNIRNAVILRWQLLKICFFGVNEFNPDEYKDEPDSIAILKLLIDNGADINVRNRYDKTPLHYAVEDNCFFRDIKYLIERGANVDAQDYEGKTPLHIAANLCDARSVQILLDAGASPLSLDQYGKTPYDIFIELVKFHPNWLWCPQPDIAKISKLLRPR